MRILYLLIILAILSLPSQLRVNGLSFGLYYGSFYTVLASMMTALLVALLALIQVVFMHKFMESNRISKDNIYIVIKQIFELEALTIAPAYATIAIMFILFIPPSLLFSSTIRYAIN